MVELASRLEGARFCKTVVVLISRGQREATYFGNLGQLRTAMAQRDACPERGTVNWILRDAWWLRQSGRGLNLLTILQILSMPPEVAIWSRLPRRYR